MSKQVVVTVNLRTGDAKVEMVGFVGVECLERLTQIIAAAGGTDATLQAKPEFYLNQGDNKEKETEKNVTT